jgi:hypothetical protein
VNSVIDVAHDAALSQGLERVLDRQYIIQSNLLNKCQSSNFQHKPAIIYAMTTESDEMTFSPQRATQLLENFHSVLSRVTSVNKSSRQVHTTSLATFCRGRQKN